MGWLTPFSQPAKPVPWRRIRSWACTSCGECCRHFRVPLAPLEYARILRVFGSWPIEIRIGRAYLRKKPDGRCVFQYRLGGMWLCGIQSFKPLACKLWPIKPLEKPKYGRSQEAAFYSRHGEFYVYLDPRCPGVELGEPTPKLATAIAEAIDLMYNLSRPQKYTTSQLAPLQVAGVGVHGLEHPSTLLYAPIRRYPHGFQP